jgi:peptidoglycan/xylan/chitin deacetylase (PgdA/CDA1 family)
MKTMLNVNIVNWYKRKAASAVYRHKVALNLAVPLISFTFDDFPESALRIGGEVLKSHGLSGTYYVSLGLLGKDAPAGRLCTSEDVVAAAKSGHELGCHTYSHCNSWDTDSNVYEQSVIQNQAALGKIVPGLTFRSFSYPLATPSPWVKRVCARHFVSCRSGSQTFNAKRVDLNQLSSYFLEKANGNLDPIKDIIQQNNRSKGWLIFATHDVAPSPSPYGCTPEFFKEVVQYAIDSGSRIMPVAEAVDVIRGVDFSQVA